MRRAPAIDRPQPPADGRTAQPDPPPDELAIPAPARRRGRWYLSIATLLLLVAAFFRTWSLGSVPPGMHAEELINAQLSEHVRNGDLSVIYDDVTPAREGLYYAILAGVSTLTGHGLMLWRIPSVWLAMLSLAVTARLVRNLFGVRVSLMSLGLMAVTFWTVWMGRTVQHVALMPLAAAGVVLLLERAFSARTDARAALWFTLGGLALGVAQYVHVTAWTLAVIYLLFVAYQAFVDRGSFRRNRLNIAYSLLLAVTLTIPLMLFLVRHPGVREPAPIAQQAGLLTQIPGRLASSLAALALHGDVLPYHNLPGRPVLGPAVGVLAVLGIGVALARWRQAPYGLLLIWMAVGLLPTAFLPNQPDFEYMAVIVPCVFVLPALGLRAAYLVAQEHLGGLLRRFSLAGLTAAVALVIAINAYRTYDDYFRVWPQRSDVQAAYQADVSRLAHYLDSTTDPSPISICSIPVDPATDPFELSNADLLEYLMHRSDLPLRFFDCRSSLVLASGGESQRIIFPRSHYYENLPGPLLAWMRYAQDEGVPGIEPGVVMRVEASDELADYLGRFTTGPYAAWPPEAAATGLAPIPLSFGYNVTFLGDTVRDETISPGDWVEMTSYWRMDGPPPPELTMFAHMLGNPVVIVAQDDGLGAQVSTLQPRDVFLQHNLIQTPGGLAAGSYTLSVGLYFPASGERLPVFDDGSAVADRIFLRGVTIER